METVILNWNNNQLQSIIGNGMTCISTPRDSLRAIESALRSASATIVRDDESLVMFEVSKEQSARVMGYLCGRLQY